MSSSEGIINSDSDSLSLLELTTAKSVNILKMVGVLGQRATQSLSTNALHDSSSCYLDCLARLLVSEHVESEKDRELYPFEAEDYITTRRITSG